MDNLTHSDQWVAFNLLKFAREADPDQFLLKREVARLKIEELTLLLRQPPTRRMTRETLLAEEKRLVGLVAGLARNPSRARDWAKARDSLARVRVLLELGPLQMTVPRARDRGDLASELEERRSELASFGDAPGEAVPLSEVEKSARVSAAEAMTARCATCHVYKGPLMEPMRSPRAVVDHTRFDHLPHMSQVGCLHCHATVANSKKAADINLPGVASCRGCHQAGKARSDCAECHVFHPQVEPWPPI